MTTLREALEQVRERHGGVLTPSHVLEDARDPDHPLHNRFTWDDAVAAEKWRLEQAHELIRVVRVTYQAPDGRTHSIRAYQAIRRDDGYRYEPSSEVAADPVARAIVLMDMRREWAQLRDRYREFEEFSDMVLTDLHDETG